jgi:hypothetical protein
VTEEQHRWILRVTRRCLLEDLEVDEGDLEAPLHELAQRSQIIRAFIQQRSQLPTGQETIQGLTSRIIAYSLHAGQFRGITWHQEAAGVVWLLAARFHRSGQRDDAYPYFQELDANGQLLPTRDDFTALGRKQANTLARSLLTDIPPLRRQVESQPGTVVQGVVGGRIRVRLLKEAGDRPMLTVAISQRLLPGEMLLPSDWLITLAAAFFPELAADQLAVAFDLGGRPLTFDEVAFCDFTSLDA